MTRFRVTLRSVSTDSWLVDAPTAGEAVERARKGKGSWVDGVAEDHELVSVEACAQEEQRP